MLSSALLTLALAACTSMTPTPTTPPSGGTSYLNGTHWVLSSDAARPPTMDFEGSRATGFAGCNRFFADVTHNGEAITFGAIGTTRMACEGPAMEVERAFVTALSNARYAHYDRDALVLMDANQQQLLRLARPGSGVR